MKEQWVPYVYQYGVGGVVFVIGLIYGWRQGYLGVRGKGLKNLAIMMGGLLFFMLLQGYLQFAPMDTQAMVTQSVGGQGQKGGLGTSLDYGIIVFYFMGILAIGTYFGRGQKSVKDFFFGGQRFSWWLIAFSLVATSIGSYSFVKYSQIAYGYGIASSQTYLNDWFWMPLFVFGWLPILYFSRLSSVPEYFEHRFGPKTRKVVTFLLLIYMIGYVGVNLFTMGRALHILIGWPVWFSAILVASISATYVTMGGQTSVIMTDLIQGVMLLLTGLLLLYLGMDQLGGWQGFWEHLPRSHRMAFPNFNQNPAYNSVGIFWQDAMANSAMFLFLNQGILMRFMAAKSVQEGRKAVYVFPLILMPVAAVVVASGGWMGKALVGAGILPEMNPKEAFFITSEFLSMPGFFGLMMAALTAALMSTVDTLVTAVSAVVVNDIYKPYLKPQASESEQLAMARWTALGVMVIGVLLVPVFDSFDTIYEAHGAFTAAITPPLVVTFLMGFFWRRYTPKAALWTLLGGSASILISILFPEVIRVMSHGVPMGEAGQGFLGGIKQYKFMRALWGLSTSFGIGLVATLLTKPQDWEQIRGWVWGSVEDAIARYKGKRGREIEGPLISGFLQVLNRNEGLSEQRLPKVWVSTDLAHSMQLQKGDLVYITDPRRWLGGLRSMHGQIQAIDAELPEQTAAIDQKWSDIFAQDKQNFAIKIQKLYG